MKHAFLAIFRAVLTNHISSHNGPFETLKLLAPTFWGENSSGTFLSYLNWHRFGLQWANLSRANLFIAIVRFPFLPLSFNAYLFTTLILQWDPG